MLIAGKCAITYITKNGPNVCRSPRCNTMEVVKHHVSYDTGNNWCEIPN
uniref:Uncharacterized protein n=1 Tax=Anopheles gambiae TaxID=7165 RepID=A0A453YZB3_ANOGA